MASHALQVAIVRLCCCTSCCKGSWWGAVGHGRGGREAAGLGGRDARRPLARGRMIIAGTAARARAACQQHPRSDREERPGDALYELASQGTSLAIRGTLIYHFIHGIPQVHADNA